MTSHVITVKAEQSTRVGITQASTPAPHPASQDAPQPLLEGRDYILTERGDCLGLMPVEGNEWEQWKARIWNQMTRHLQFHPGLAPLEQWVRRSSHEKRCIDCGEPGTAEQEGGLIKAVKSYWICQDCADYWSNRR